jgi:DNA polymerase III subunit chi
VTRVDFYVLQDVDLAAATRFACRLAAKAISTGHRVHIHTGAPDQATELDELLWHYPEGRFLPHAREDDPSAGQAPVVVGWSAPERPDGVLINLAAEVPTFFGRFDRVAEIVVDANRDDGRKRYRFYRDRGFPLHDHRLDDWESA